MQTSLDNYRVHTNPLDVLQAGQLFWLPSLYFIVHTLEELPSFASWVTRHFGSMTTDSFAFVHIPLILLVMLGSYQASIRVRHGGWVVFATAAQWQFGLNAMFHLVTAVIFREYSPGLITAVCLAFPLTGYFMLRVWQEQHLTKAELTVAVLIGTVMVVAAIGVLFLH